MEQKKPRTKAESGEVLYQPDKGDIPVKAAFLHEPIRIDGQTESTITPQKLRALKSVSWSHDHSVLIIVSQTGEKHRIPSANVKQTIDA